jgi:DNA-binding NarL/FixJ family response regulator
VSRPAHDERLDAELTRRELEVLAMLAEGETNARIAQRLVLSQDTVKTHVKHILRKLGVHNRSQAVSRYFRAHGASEDDPFKEGKSPIGSMRG